MYIKSSDVFNSNMGKDVYLENICTHIVRITEHSIQLNSNLHRKISPENSQRINKNYLF